MSHSEKTVENNKFASLILSFVLSIFLLITSATLIVNGFILSSNGVIGSLRQSNYHADVYAHLRDSIGDTLIPTGVPASILNDAFTSDDVYADLNAYIVYMFANNLPNLQREAIAEILNANIGYFLYETGRSRSDVGEEAITGIVDAIIDNYNDYIGSPFLAYMARTSNLFGSYLQQLIIVGLVGMLITMGIIFLISRRFKHLAFRYVGFSFGTAALMVIAAPLALRIWGGHHRLGIGPEFVYNFVVTHIERSISAFLLIGSVFIALYLVFIIISGRLHRKWLQA